MLRKDTRSLVTALLFGASACTFLLIVPTGTAIASQVNIADVTASSTIPPTGSGFDRVADHLINGTGLNAAGEHNTTPDGGMWLSAGNGSFGGVDPDPQVLFDLGAVYTINSFHVWNYNEGGSLSSRGVKNVTVEYGSTAGLGSTVAGITQFAKAPGTGGYAGENFNTFTPFTARYINFDIASGIDNGNWGDGSTFYGLSEVQFEGRLTNVITGVTIEDFSSEMTNNGGREAINTIDGTGFNATNGTHNSNAADMWLTDGPFQSDEGNDVLPSHITFDLGDNYDLEALHVWNYNEAAAGNTDRGAQDVEISVASSEGGLFSSIGDFVFDQASGLVDDEGQLIALADIAGADNVRLIRFDITSNHGDGDNVVGLSEVRFSGTVIPEPSSLALLSLSGLIIARRRRR